MIQIILKSKSSAIPIGTNEPIRALSWKQPYASAMLHGKVETRIWSTTYRGWVLICASQKEYTYPELKNIAGTQFTRLKKLIIDNNLQSPITGHAIAIGKLVDCYQMSAADCKAAYVAWLPGLYCHVYEQVTRINPIPWKGSQGWRTLTTEQRQLIKSI